MGRMKWVAIGPTSGKKLATDMGSSNQPIFVVCHARSGSTLMRYILDTHEDLCCPPELQLGPVMQQLVRVNNILYERNPAYSDPQKAEEKIYACVRQGIDELMGRVCLDFKKKRWCEKSVSTVDHLAMIGKAYPEARYICLYRHCMDFVHSALETMGKDGGYGYEAYVVSRNPDNMVDSLVAFWCEKTRKIRDFEKTNQSRCFSVKYECLVGDPEAICRPLFEFLNLSYDDKLLSKVFQSRHYAGPGDPKILTTRRIERRSVGLGRKVSALRIEPAMLAQMNFLLKALNYETVDAGWNKKAYSLYASDPLTQRYVADKLREIFETLIPARLATVSRPRSGNLCEVHIKDVEDGTWLIDFDKKSCSKIAGAQNGSRITLGFETLLKLTTGEMNMGEAAMRDGMIHAEGVNGSLWVDVKGCLS